MAVKGLMVDPVTNMPLVVLQGEDPKVALPIWVGVFEANAIALQLEGIPTPRPMTHDLLRSLVEELGAKVSRVIVSELRESTFHAVLELAVADAVRRVDCRPSDGIALALRAGAPIFVEEEVLAAARDSDLASEDPEKLRSWFEGLPEEDLGGYEM